LDAAPSVLQSAITVCGAPFITLKFFPPEEIIASDLLVAGSKGVNETQVYVSGLMFTDLEYSNNAESMVSLLCA